MQLRSAMRQPLPLHIEPIWHLKPWGPLCLRSRPQQLSTVKVREHLCKMKMRRKRQSSRLQQRLGCLLPIKGSKLQPLLFLALHGAGCQGQPKARDRSRSPLKHTVKQLEEQEEEIRRAMELAAVQVEKAQTEQARLIQKQCALLQQKATLAAAESRP